MANVGITIDIRNCSTKIDVTESWTIRDFFTNREYVGPDSANEDGYTYGTLSAAVLPNTERTIKLNWQDSPAFGVFRVEQTISYLALPLTWPWIVAANWEIIPTPEVSASASLSWIKIAAFRCLPCWTNYFLFWPNRNLLPYCYCLSNLGHCPSWYFNCREIMRNHTSVAANSIALNVAMNSSGQLRNYTDFSVEASPYQTKDNSYEPDFFSENSYTKLSNWIAFEKLDFHVEPSTSAETIPQQLVPLATVQPVPGMK